MGWLGLDEVQVEPGVDGYEDVAEHVANRVAEAPVVELAVPVHVDR